jgi:primosomal protein N' (replication factor Y)
MSAPDTESLFAPQQGDELAPANIIRVAFEAGVDNEFDYSVPDTLWPIRPGQRVRVPFGRKNKLEAAFCVESDVPFDRSFAAGGKKRSLKKVNAVIDAEPLLDAQLMDLSRWISQYYVCPLGQVLSAMVPAAVKKGAGLRTEKYIYLAKDADDAIKKLSGKKQKQIVKILRERQAFAPDSAVSLQSLLTEVGCTNVPVNNLAEKLIIKIAVRTAFRTLPAIPEAMRIETAKVILNIDQENALTQIKGRLDAGKFAVILLHGVTDSGKTEVYIRAIEEALQKKRQAIVLLPEIALTAQTVQRFSDRFKRIAVLHSELPAAQRNAQWQKIKAGDADVVLGARSAIFAPVSNLGMVVVDEEHEPVYKQDNAPRYHAKDVAVKRAQLANALCILGSATPSLETLFNAKIKKHYTLLSLPKRVMDLPAPEMKLVDMRLGSITHKGLDLISHPLAEHLRQTFDKKEQAILLLNRRGYSNFVFCPSCKHSLRCRNCDVTLTFHKSKIFSEKPMQTIAGRHLDYGYVLCHYCGAQSLVPAKCPVCGSGLAMIGLGSQRLEEELTRKFPDARLARVDSDSMAGQDYYGVLKDFSTGRLDVLLGTQMLAKGLHFPNVTLVGIISADTSLQLPDFRANERTFQLICQVAGRAGRSPKKGTVYVQTFLPDQPAIQLALRTDFCAFVHEELKHRKACHLPPFWRLANILIRDRNFDRLETAANNLRQKIDAIIGRLQLHALVRGPMPAVIPRIQRFHRMQIIIQAPKPSIIRSLFDALRAAEPLKPHVHVAVDVDPVNLL